MDAAPETVTLWSSLVARGVLERTLLPRFRAITGANVDASFDPTMVLMRRLQEEPPPAVILSTTESLEACDLIDRSTRVDLIRTGIGVGVAAGSPHPSIDSPAEFADTLLGARSVAYSRAGQSGIYFATLLARLGIADAVNSRATIIEKGFTGEAVIDGRADIAIQQVSELRFVTGIEVLGFLPEEVQQYTDFSVALVAGHPAPGARELLDFLVGPIADDVYRLERLIVPPTRA